jgi:CheY-like chemotaxis protein
MKGAIQEKKAVNRNLRILHIEDDEIDQRKVARALSKLNIDLPLHSVRDGQEALELLRGKECSSILNSPLLILLDLNMPRVSGIEFLEKIRKEPGLKRAVVLVFTTSNDESDKMRAYDYNVAGYILKTNDAEDFQETMRVIKDYISSVEFPTLIHAA